MKNKAKTRKSLSKRFKITSSGKVMRRTTGQNHLRGTKSKRTKQAKHSWIEVPAPLAKKIKKLIKS
jgi:large subunit ribosomal protein L35